ncbi:MAG TPA: hypothetical protein VJZ26_11160 [Blastocatellia bacterium]|nr:hypothetical protein [Blastocatellia bacterium]
MKYIGRVALVAAALLLMSLSQSTVSGQQSADQPGPVTRGTDIYCAGYISELPPRTDLQIVGAEKENQKATFAQGDVVFLNRGRGSGIEPGKLYFILRPLGQFKHPFTKKKLGYYVRELGLLRVLEVGDQTSTAEIAVSCDMVEFGDLLKPYEEYVTPGPREARPLPRYGEGSGGTVGQIIMSPGYHEHLSANRVVYIDLGNRQDVRPGDYFTIYREIGMTEGITKVPQYKVMTKRSKGYQSSRYRGGDYSVQDTRSSAQDVMKQRPPLPRKVVGEIIILKVENTSSVALITRTTGEVTVGDHVERSN